MMRKIKKIKQKIFNNMTKERQGFAIQPFDDSLRQRKNFKSTNSKFSLFTYVLVFFLIIIPLIAFVLINTFPHLVLEDYLFSPIFYFFFTILLLIYFLIARYNYYILKIDAYIIDIKIYRAIFGIYNLIDYVDISQEMFIDFSFSNRPFSFNKNLILEIKTDEGKRIKKNLNLSFLSKKEESRISRFFAKIITKNKLKEILNNKINA